MGYDLHITRRELWANQGNDITAHEWLALVKNEPDLKLEPQNGPYFVLWGGKSTLKSPWLDWTRGQIYTKNPDDALIDKMVSVAQKLGAVVQGDEGEIYRSAEDAHFQNNSSAIPSFSVRYPKWPPIVSLFGGVMFLTIGIALIVEIRTGIVTVLLCLFMLLLAYVGFLLAWYSRSSIEVNTNSATVYIHRNKKTDSYSYEELSYISSAPLQVFSVFEKKSKRRLVMFDNMNVGTKELSTWANKYLSKNKSLF